jgi:hypothetical protein
MIFMRRFVASALRGRSRVVLAWLALVVVAAVLLQWVDPAVFESPYAGF